MVGAVDTSCVTVQDPNNKKKNHQNLIISYNNQHVKAHPSRNVIKVVIYKVIMFRHRKEWCQEVWCVGRLPDAGPPWRVE